MSDFDYEDSIDEFDGDLPKKLRKQLESALKTIKEQEKQIAELAAVRHEQTVGQMLAEYGINPKIAAFIPDDVETEDDLAAWLYEYGDVFGIEPADESADPEYQGYADDAQLMQDIESGGIDPEVGLDLQSQIDGASSPEELLALLRNVGA